MGDIHKNPRCRRTRETLSDLKRIPCARLCYGIRFDRDAGDDSTQIIVAYCLYLHNCLVRIKVNYELVLETV